METSAIVPDPSIQAEFAEQTGSWPSSSDPTRHFKLREGLLMPESRTLDLTASETSQQNGGVFDQLATASSRLGLEPTSSKELQLSDAQLAGIIVAAALVTLGVIGLAVWLHVRRKKKKNPAHGDSANSNGHLPVGATVSVISMPDGRQSASRQNSNGLHGSMYYKPGSGMDGPGGDIEDEFGSFTDYGSVLSSFPPSPTLSYRSALDGPGFSRSRAGTGTSFGTVASFSSHRSRLSHASFKTCVEEELP